MNRGLWKKNILFVNIMFIIGCAIGVYLGVILQKKVTSASAAGLWMVGVEALKAEAYDYALINFIHPVALKNDEPMFLRSVAEVYEKKKNSMIAIEFYKRSLELYKKKNYGPINQVEQKISQLEQKK